MAPTSAERLQQALAIVNSKRSSSSSTRRKRSGDADIVAALIRASAGTKDPLGGSKNALDAKVAAILASNAPDTVKQSVLKQSSSAPKNESWWEQGLNILGKPKSLIVAAVGRTADPRRNLLKDVQRNIGVGGLLENQDWYKNLPGAAKFAIGLTGDIALDPLTYLAGAGALTKIGGASGAAKLAFNASAAAGAAGDVNKAAQLASIGQKASKGVSTLTKAERVIVSDLGAAAGKIAKGEKLGGLYLNVPGTGRILGKVTGLPLTQIPIIPEGALSSAIPKGIRGVEEFTRASVVGQKAKKYIGGNETKAALTNFVRRGTPEQANAAFHTLDAWNLGEARYASYLRDMESARTDLSNIAKKSNVDMTDITKALGGDVNAAARVNRAVAQANGMQDFMAQVRRFDDAVVDEAHRLAGKEFIPKIADHAPTLPGPGVKGGTPVVRRNPYEAAGFEKYAKSKPGETFEGETILHPTDTSYGEVVGIGDEGQILTRHVAPEDVDAAIAEGRDILPFGPDPKGRSPKQQVDEIARSKYGPEYEDMYNMDWDMASAAQVRGVANRVRGEVIKNHIRSKGVAKDLYEEVLTNAAQQAREMLPGLRIQKEVMDANAGILRVLRDIGKADLGKAQQNLEWVVKESADNVARTRQASEAMSEAYGTVPQTVQALFDEAAAAGVRLENAVLDRKMAEEILTVLGPDSPMLEMATARLRKISEDLAADTAKATDQMTSLESAIEKYSALYQSLDDTLKSNWRMADRIDELSQEFLEKSRQLDELRGIAPDVPPRRGMVTAAGESVEDVVYRNIDPLTPSKKTLNTSSIVNDSAKAAPREATTGRNVLTREGNIVADYDNFKEIVDDWVLRETARAEGTLAKAAGKTADMPGAAGAAIDVKSAARVLNKSLRDAGLPTIPVGISPAKMLEKADEILAKAKIDVTIEKPLDVGNYGKPKSRSARIAERKLKREIDAITKELDELQASNPRETLAKLMAERDLMADSVEDFGVSLQRVTTRVEDARIAENVNQSKIDKLKNDRIAASEKNRRAVVQEKIDTEIAMREEVTRLRNEALAADDRVRVTREQVQAADNEAMQAEMVAAMEIDKAQASVARLEAMTLQNEADLARMNRRSVVLEEKIGRLSEKENMTTFKQALDDGFARLDMSTQAPDHIVEALTQMTKLQDPKELGRLMKTFDAATGLFKSWAILTPGFHVRNFIGGVFNNYLAGMDFASYRSFLKADKIFMKALESSGDRELALKAVGRAMGREHMEAYRVVDSSAALKSSGQIGSASGEIGVGTIGMANGRGFSKFKKTLTSKGRGNFVVDNPLTRVNYAGSERVERTLRGSLAYDTALKGGDQFEVLGNVYKFHFNYEDLSDIERRYMKRISPFYTWSRRNVPLQVEMLFQKPGVYANIGVLQDNIEQLSPQDGLVPAWFSEVGGFRLPFTNPNGERLYMMPDLPPLDLRKVVNPQEWLGEINPVLKVPFELQFNRQLYNKQEFREGYVPFPEAWNKLGIGAITDAVGITKQDANGQRVGRDSQMYALESYLPLLGRVRRLFPSEDKYQRRAVATWASMLFGLGFRANTEADQKGELYRRSKNVDRMNIDLESLSYGGYKTLSKDVATKRAPAKGEKSPYLMAVEPKGGLPLGSSYTMPTQGRSGGEALAATLRRLKTQNASSDLVNLINRIEAGRKK